MKLQRIVVGVDFRAHSVAAAHWAARDFAPLAEIVLVHAVDTPRPPRLVRGALAPIERVTENAVAGAHVRLTELGAWVEDPRVDTEIVIGPAADRLVEVVDVRGADLVILGGHGSTRGVWEFLGTTAERVIRRASVPVLVARGTLAGTPRRILAAVDDTGGGRRALEWATFLGRQLGANLVALHALEPVVPSAEILGLMPIGEIQEDLRLQAERWLDEAVREAGAGGDTAVSRVVVGDPVHHILQAAERQQSDLVVIGSRGAGAVGGVLGAVSRGVLRRGTGPVLVVGPLAR